MVNGDHTNHDAGPGQRNFGDALPRIRQLVCIHDVGARYAAIRAGSVDRNSWYRRLADRVEVEPRVFDRWHALSHL